MLIVSGEGHPQGNGSPGRPREIVGQFDPEIGQRTIDNDECVFSRRPTTKLDGVTRRWFAGAMAMGIYWRDAAAENPSGNKAMKFGSGVSVCLMTLVGIAASLDTRGGLFGQEAGQPRPPRVRNDKAGSDIAASRPNGSSSSTSTADMSNIGTDTIILTVWDISIGNSAANKDADEKANLKWRLENFPTEFASLKEVRDFVVQLKDAGRLRSVRELRLMTQDGQTATTQLGGSKPQIVGFNQTARGRTNTISFREAGTVIEARPKVDSQNHIQVRFKYDMSDLQKSDKVAMSDDADGKPLFADVIVKRQFETTARLKDGTCAVLRCDSTAAPSENSSPGQIELIILGGAIAKE